MKELAPRVGRVKNAQQVQWVFAADGDSSLPWDLESEVEPMERLLREKTGPGVADCWMFYKFEGGEQTPRYIATKTHWPDGIHYKSGESWEVIIKAVRTHFYRVQGSLRASD